MRKTVLVALGASFLAPAALPAQRRPERPRRPAPEMRSGGLGLRGGQRADRSSTYSPRRLLARRDALALSDQQVEQLRALVGDLDAANDRVRDATRAHGSELRDAMRADRPDPEVIAGHARAIMDARRDAAIAGLTAAARAKGVLTDGQRGRVRGWSEGAGMRHGRPGAARRQRHRPVRRF